MGNSRRSFPAVERGNSKNEIKQKQRREDKREYWKNHSEQEQEKRYPDGLTVARAYRHRVATPRRSEKITKLT